jgi:hypothetical protein
MVPLTSPNGVTVLVHEADVARLVALGYAEQAKPTAPKRRTTRKKPAKGE